MAVHAHIVPLLCLVLMPGPMDEPALCWITTVLQSKNWQRPQWWTQDYETVVIQQRDAFDASQGQPQGQPQVAQVRPCGPANVNNSCINSCHATCAAQPIQATAVPVQSTVDVTIPPNAIPGQTMQIEANGRQFQFQVPQGATPGMKIQVNLG